VVLADHLASLTPNGGKNLLEIGCGLGLVGIVAAAFGHKVTMTEQNSDALNFARANALTNLSPSSPPIDIRRLDWNHPDLDDMFDLIVGSEVVYSQFEVKAQKKIIRTPEKEIRIMLCSMKFK